MATTRAPKLYGIFVGPVEHRTRSYARCGNFTNKRIANKVARDLHQRLGLQYTALTLLKRER